MNRNSPPSFDRFNETMPANVAQFPTALANNVLAGIEQEEKDRFDPLRLFSYLVRHRWLVGICIILGMASGLLFTQMQTPMYRSTAKIEIAKPSARVLQDIIDVTSELDELQAYETARQKILSRDIAARVVRKLKLADDDGFLTPVSRFPLLSQVKRNLLGSTTRNVKELSAEQRESLAINIVRSGLEATLVRNSSLISVRFHHSNRQYTSAIVNQVARSFMDQSIDNKSQTSALARQFIQDRVVEVKENLEKSERALVDYAEQAGLTVVGNDQSLISANISDLNRLITKTVEERLIAEKHVGQMREGGAASLPQVFESRTIQAAKNRLVELRSIYKQKSTTLKAGFPEMRKLRSQISEIKRNMQAEINSIGKGVRVTLQQIKAKEESLQRELQELELKQREFERKNIRYTILKRDADSNRTQYESLIKKLNEVGIGAELKNAGAAIIDAGQTPSAPYAPNLILNLAAALFAFSAMGIFLIIVLELLNNTFSIPEQIEKELKIPMLGLIPKLSTKQMESDSFNSASSFAEAYRTLRTSVQFTGTETTMKHLVVTSPGADEGKTTTSIRLATDFAALGRQVLLIDGDLRKPCLHKLFKTDNIMGLSNLLSNVVVADTAKDCFKTTKHPNLTLLTAGTVPPNPADLLASPRMGVLLDFLSKQFDMIIIDSPPIIGLSDAPLFCRLADATLVVLACKETKRDPAKSALARLSAAGGHVVGAVLTKFEVDPLDYNSSYRHLRDNYYTYGTSPSKKERRKIEDPPTLAAAE